MSVGLLIFADILPLIILFFGIIGNFLSFIVFSGKKLRRVSLNFILCFMTITDTLALLQIVQLYKEFHIRRLSVFTCKFFTFIAFSFYPLKGKYIKGCFSIQILNNF